MIRRNQVRQIKNLQVKFAGLMGTLAEFTDGRGADERHGSVVIRMEEELVRSAQRARDELAAIDAADAARRRN